MATITSCAKGAYTFGLRGNISFDNVVEYIKRLGYTVSFYTDAEADSLNEKHRCDAVDFREIKAATVVNKRKGFYAVYFHKRKDHSSKNELKTAALHELGHILLNHLEDIGKDNNRRIYESEAELFVDIIEQIAQGKIKTQIGAAK